MRVSVFELLHHHDSLIQKFGQFVFEKVFVRYTAKQWGVPAEQADTGAFDRIPVCLSYDDRYFGDTIQTMPLYGFTPLLEKLLADRKISL